MKAFIKRLLKVINMIITVPLWLLWALMWLFLTIPVWIVAFFTYVAIGKDILEWWFDKIDIIAVLSVNIDKKLTCYENRH